MAANLGGGEGEHTRVFRLEVELVLCRKAVLCPLQHGVDTAGQARRDVALKPRHHVVLARNARLLHIRVGNHQRRDSALVVLLHKEDGAVDVMHRVQERKLWRCLWL